MFFGFSFPSPRVRALPRTLGLMSHSTKVVSPHPLFHEGQLVLCPTNTKSNKQSAPRHGRIVHRAGNLPLRDRMGLYMVELDYLEGEQHIVFAHESELLELNPF